ncbi:unnamed protein product [Triticum turgidum subsp. durum]|uniref:Cytochrome c oxidase subunit Vb n=1 Tax=Triticum turgidum subsp. durum TaxID=4567 RepID=A0A9R1S241_TRITD|nr:unnamed protein product [Triticum turgidum subsp. durum]
MWRRLQTLAPALRRAAAAAGAAPSPASARAAPLSTAVAAFRRTGLLLSGVRDECGGRHAHCHGVGARGARGGAPGKKRFDMDPPVGPFGTKEAPAVIESYFDKRIVGCPGDEGEDEHDVVWFWLKKDEPHECPVCSQYFVLKVIGDGGNPDGHDDDDDGHHH